MPFEFIYQLYSIFKGLKELAEGFSHHFAGWLVFILASCFLLLIALILKKLEEEKFEIKKIS